MIQTVNGFSCVKKIMITKYTINNIIMKFEVFQLYTFSISKKGIIDYAYLSRSSLNMFLKDKIYEQEDYYFIIVIL